MGSGPQGYPAGQARECFEVADSGRNASCDAGPGTDKTKITSRVSRYPKWADGTGLIGVWSKIRRPNGPIWLPTGRIDGPPRL